MRTLSCFCLLLLTPSCATTYRKDLQLICNAHELSGASPTSGLAEVGPWLESRLGTDAGRALLRSAAQTGSIEAVRAAAAEQRVTPCPLVEPR